MADNVRGDVTRVVPNLKTGNYYLAVQDPPLDSKVAVERGKKVTRAVRVKAGELMEPKRRRGARVPIRTRKRSTPPAETTSGQIVIGAKSARQHGASPSDPHDLVSTVAGGDVEEPRAQVQDYTKRILAQLELKLKTRLSSIDAADIDLSALGPVDEIAETMLSQLPASHPFDEVVGPFYEMDGAANRMHVSAETVQARVRSNELLACPTAEGDLVFPTFQFTSDGTALPWLGRVLSALAAGTEDRWHVAMWLNTPNEQLNDETPRDLLNDGKSAAVLKVAEQTAERWCH